MSKGYINVCDLLYFINIYINRENLCDTTWVLGGRGHPSSHMLGILQITIGLLYSIFMFIVTLDNCLFDLLIM